MSAEQGSFLEVVVARKYQEAEDVVVVELSSRDGRDLSPFTPGAHIDVFLAPGLVRQYSLCGSAASTSRYRIAVLREAQSRGGSVHVHDRLSVGQALTIGCPRNHFPLQRTAGRSVLLAGGIGVTPILCMADELQRRGAEFHFHYCARSRSRAAFVEAIASSPFAAHVGFHFDDGPASQRMNMDEAIGEHQQQDHLYVCGPRGFIGAVFEEARQIGWPEASLHSEHFSAPAPTDQKPFTIRLRRSERTLHVPSHKTVVQVLQEAGITIDVSCEQGICGTCITRVLEGEPDHRDSVLTEEERAQNDQFTPCCSRSRTPVLTLDL